MRFLTPTMLKSKLEYRPVLSPDAPTLTRNITSSAPGTTLPGSVCRGLSQWTPEYPLSCPSELWLVLDLDAKNWQKFKKFTLRLSWPAFVCQYSFIC